MAVQDFYARIGVEHPRDRTVYDSEIKNIISDSIPEYAGAKVEEITIVKRNKTRENPMLGVVSLFSKDHESKQASCLNLRRDTPDEAMQSIIRAGEICFGISLVNLLDTITTTPCGMAEVIADGSGVVMWHDIISSTGLPEYFVKFYRL